jgi:chorismate mutase
MPVRGIRGAIVAKENTREAILEATRELLLALIAANDIQPEDVASAWFTTTPGLNAEFPALAARSLGWYDVAVLCAHEMDVPQGMQNVVRILIHLNTDRPAHAIKHIYMGEAAALRPDRPLPVEIAK